MYKKLISKYFKQNYPFIPKQLEFQVNNLDHHVI